MDAQIAQIVADSDVVALVRAVPLREDERDALLIDMHTRVKLIESRVTALDDHEARLRSVEKKVWGVPGTIIAALLAFVGIHFQ